MSKNNSYSFISLGCARTLMDTQDMVQRMNKVGFELQEEGTGEAVSVLNTCSFIQAAIDETEANIRVLSENKKEGKTKYVVVVGCYPSRFKKEALTKRFPEVDLWLTTKEENLLHRELAKLVFDRKYQPKENVPYIKLTPNHFSYIKISEGCDNWCGFCTIPAIRGKHTSKPLEEIIKEAEFQLTLGAKELILVAEDTTAWGEDIYGKPSFPLLLKELSKLPVKWIRPMYIFPARVDQELIDVMRDTPNITNYIDMPVQHVSDPILEGMNRRHTKADLEDILKKFYTAIPGITIRTSILVGYPGETEEIHNELLDFITGHPFDHIGCFAYSDERGTKSFETEGKVEIDVIRARISDVLNAQQEQLTAHREENWVGQTFEVVYEGQGLARSEHQAPDVDGYFIIDDFEDHDLVPGEFYQVKATEVEGYNMLAEVV